MKKSIVSLVALLVAAAVPAMAFAEAKPYASIRYETMYVDVDKAGSGDTTDLDFGLQGNTRLGVKFKVSDQVSGQVEMGLKDSDNGNTVSLRLAYAVYDFGPGTLTIGQDYAAFDWGYGSVAGQDNDGAGYGALSIPRSSQVTLRLDAGLYVSLIDQRNDNVDVDDIEYPILAAGYDGKIGAASVGAGVGYASYEKTAGNDADTYFIYAQGEVPVGPASIAAKIYYGQNLEEISVSAPNASYTAATDDDADTLAGFIAATAKLSDKLKIAGGVGYLTTDTGVAGETDDDQIQYYVDLHYKVTKGFTIKPTITFNDNLDEKDGSDGDQTLYFGAQWRFDL